MRIRPALLSFLAGVFSCLVCLASADTRIKIQVQPVFQGAMPETVVNPYQVELQNNGADANGVLEVITGSRKTSYPIDLPQGADKRLLIYPVPQYDGVHLELLTNQGNFKTEVRQATPGEEGLRILTITSDVPGELGFIRADPSKPGANGEPQSQSQTQLWDVYSRPGESPTRPVGYGGVSAILLGAGAERLTDEEVDAIHEWVLNGHTLVFLGGASAPILSDRRWAEMLPAHDFHLASLAGSAFLDSLGNGHAPTATVTTGTPNPGAFARMDDGKLVYAEQPFGLGKAVYISFNPLEAPMDKWEGRRAAMTRILRVSESLLAGNFIQSYASEVPPSPYGGTTPYSTYSAGTTIVRPATPDVSIADDPFSTKLPSTERIFSILAAYFIAVVPLNFWLLKKLKRGELAWVTAPILSLGFAAFLFMSASSLYKAKMSTVSRGLLLAQDGGGSGIFIGSTQMFIPKAGSYDLKLKGVDSLSEMNQQEYYEAGDRDSDLEPVDNGEITIPDLSANNLNFRSLSYHQLAPVSQWFHVRLTSTGGQNARCDISNVGPYPLKNASVAFGAASHTLGDLSPGEMKSVPVNLKQIYTVPDLAPQDVRNFTSRSPRAALTGTLSGFRPGPQLGDDLTGRSQVTLVMFSSWAGGKP